MIMIMMKMMLMMIKVDSPILDYKHQVETLTEAGFALWDVVTIHSIISITAQITIDITITITVIIIIIITIIITQGGKVHNQKQ